MIPVKFAEYNKVWAAEQKDDYLPLPAYTDTFQTITCWKLTWRERLTMLIRGRLWLRQLNYGEPLQPQAPSTECPFADRTRDAKDWQ